MAEVASAESDLTFSVYPNGQLGDNAAMIQLVKAGVLDIAKVSASSMEQFNSAYAIFSMPYVFESTEQYFAVMNQSEAVQEIFKSTYDQGFFAIGWFDSGSRSIYTTKDGPCEGPADLKGLKIRTQDSPTSISMIRAMGGSATPMSSGETYTGLQQGIIDGAENNETVLVQDGHGEVCKRLLGGRYGHGGHDQTDPAVLCRDLCGADAGSLCALVLHGSAHPVRRSMIMRKGASFHGLFSHQVWRCRRWRNQ